MHMGRQASGGQADGQTGSAGKVYGQKGKWWTGRWADRQVVDMQMSKQARGGQVDDRQASDGRQLGRQASGGQAGEQTGKWCTNQMGRQA